jgi:L-methionine (R)-S-oxide reductase
MQNKKQKFTLLQKQVKEIINNNSARRDKLQAICQLLKDNIDYYDWVGFYIADIPKSELILGPFVGKPTEHTKIPFGRGICGQAAERKETFVIQDVSKQTNYLSCSPKVKSEIVVPIFKNGKVVGQIDIDSHITSPFTHEDKQFLAAICKAASKLFLRKAK